MTPTLLEPALVKLYSSHRQRQTIRHHVLDLRRRGFVWWARFDGQRRRLDEQSAREEWPHVAALAQKTDRGEPIVVFVSDHVALHALKVTRVVLGDDPQGGVRKEAPAYYEDTPAAIWFRVEDVRALSFDPLLTNDWFLNRLGPVLDGASRSGGARYERPYDPHASALYRFPIVVAAPPASALFAASELPKGAKRFADSDDAIAPRRVQRAMNDLAPKLGALWPRLSVAAQEKLANAWVQKEALDRGDDIDPNAAFLPIALAIEIELRDGLLAELEAHVRALVTGKQSAAARAVADVLASAKPADDFALGTAIGALSDLLKRARRALDELGLAEVAKVAEKPAWLKRVRDLRNPAAHGRAAERAALTKAVEAFFDGEHRHLAGIVAATERVRGVRRG